MQELPVSFAPLKSSFINIPIRWANALWDTDQNQTTFEIQYKHKGTLKRIFYGWSGGCSRQSSKEVLEIDYSYKSILQLQEGQMLTIKTVNLPLGKMISVEPLTPDDWEILELNAGLLEEQFLNQIRVVYVDQIINIWINNAAIKLKVLEIDNDASKNAACLNTDTEVVVAPKTRHKVSSKDKFVDKVVILSKVCPMEWSTVSKQSAYQIILPEKFGIETDSLVYVQNMDYNHLVLPISDGNVEAPNQLIKGVFAKVVLDKSSEFPVMDCNMANQLGIYPFSRVKISLVPKNAGNSVTVSIETPATLQSSKAIVSALKNRLKAMMDPDFIIYDRLSLELPVESLPVVVQFKVKAQNSQSQDIWQVPPFVTVDGKSLDKLEIAHVVNGEMKVPPKHISGFNYLPLEMVGYQSSINTVRHFIQECSMANELYEGSKINPCVLIHAGIGSGKTTFAKTMVDDFQRMLNYFAIWFDCGSIKSNPVGRIKDYLSRTVLQSTWHEPTIIALDDLDALIPAERENEPNSSRSKQIAHFFLEKFGELLKDSNVILLATASEKESLHPLLLKSMFFSKTVHLTTPNKSSRITIFKNLIKVPTSDLNLEDICGRMDGYCLADLNYFYETCLNEMTIRHIKHHSPKKLCDDDVEEAFKKYKPISISNSKVEESKVKWSSIGGMVQTKKVLLETLKWPTMYPQIFEKSPLRLRSGILLYGYPGCGKTMLANAVAKECGLNFISVKGPELLNKYIGASEKAVRDLFERARGCKPCCLFFDEFDSVAPQRGHDNSGVTDRVVNQLLTEMDGAEGLEGVYVLAATSRPESIDPALLRPGRLDKSIFCDMPSVEERLDILQRVSETIKLTESIDLSDIAGKTEGFSGADLQGLLYNAQLLAINERMAKKTIKREESVDIGEVVVVQGDVSPSRIKSELQVFESNQIIAEEQQSDAVIVQPSHLAQAMEQTRPSLRKDEYLKLYHDYRRFQGLEVDKSAIGTKALYG